VRAKSYEKYADGTYYDIMSLPKTYLAELGTSKSYNYLAHFQNTVKTKTKTDYVSLLEKQKPFYKNFAEETKRFDKVLSKKVGRVRISSCLENFLTDNHLRTFSSETEYSAYVMTKPDSELALIIIYTQVNNGTNSITQISNLVEGYRKQGWNLESHIHNHPFFFKNPYGDIAGTIMPSGADVTSYQEMGEDLKLRSAIITNGFESFIMYKNEFNKF
jgi:hypothetical protein